MAAKSEESSFSFLPQGAIIQEFNIAGQNIVLSLPSAGAYESHSTAYFGETIGRVANRIKGARIDSLAGKSWDLKANNGPNTLHGGPKGWGKQTFKGPVPVNRTEKEGVLFMYKSPHEDEGFPGTVELMVWYTASKETHEGKEMTVLEIEYEVELVGDEVEETAVAVTNHSYFNISGAETIEGTEATLYTNLHQAVDSEDVPTGSIEPFPGIEAGKMFVLGAEKPHVDHCFIANAEPASIPLDTRGLPLRKLCSFHHPKSRLNFECLSTEPAFQFYTGAYIDIPAVEGAPARGPRSGFCVEASRYIDAVNHDNWKNMVVLKKGEVWGSKTIYRGWKD